MSKSPLLPLELLVEIFTSLDNATAANMLLTCRAVYGLCQQMWYRSVDLAASPETCASEVRLSRFLRTVLRQPELGTLVHELAIGRANRVLESIENPDDEFDTLAERNFLETIHPDNGDESLITATFPRLVPANTPIFRDDFLYSPELFRLLELLPHLRTLRVVEGATIRDTLTFAALGMLPSGLPAGLRDIISLHVKFGAARIDEPDHFTAQDILPVFSLPSLRSLTVEKLVDKGPDWRWETFIEEKLWDHGMSSITHLSLESCDIAPPLLSTLLVLPKELHSLRYSMVPDPHHRHGFDWDSFSAAIYTHSGTLTTLDVSSLTTHDYSSEAGPTVGTLESLRDFSVLQHVRLPARALLGPARDNSNTDSHHPQALSLLLPASLITLELRLNWPWDLRYFMDRTSCPELWWNEKVNLPHLTSFVVRRFGGDDAARKASSDLIDAFADSGIIIDPPLGELS